MSPKKTNAELEVLAYTSKGTIKGDTRFYNDKLYYSFEHVPYAQVPVGDLRFAGPKDIKKFDDVKCNYRKLDYRGRYGDEDFLFVNIYTPEVPQDTCGEYCTRPVIVFVPGSSLNDPNCAFGGKYFMGENIVLVVLYYRPGLLGFTGFQEPNDDLNVPGDAGFQDIIKGFEFVKNEIRSFGGCPDNITAYGQGISCAYIRYMTVRPFSGKFFHKMILSSSMEHSLENTLQRHQYDLREIAGIIGPDEKFVDDKACVEYLREVPFGILARQIKSLYKIENQVVVRKNDLLCIQKDIYEMQIPVLIGFNSMEGVTKDKFGPEDTKFIVYLGSLLFLSQTVWKRIERVQAAAKIIADYLEELKKIKRDDIFFATIDTDIKYLIGTIHLATNLAKEMDPRKVYLYQFSADITKNSVLNPHDDKYYPGVSHSHELFYLFNNLHEKVPVDYKLVKRMTGIWARFAETGNPNPEKDNTWQPIGNQLTHYFEIRPDDAKFRVFSDLEKFRLRLWEKIFEMDFFSGHIKEDEPKRNANIQRKKNVETEMTIKNYLHDEQFVTPRYIAVGKEKRKSKVTAHTGKGSIQGDVYFYKTYSYNSFQHVPYAKVPTGNLRFAAPENFNSFDEVKRSGPKLDQDGRYGLEDNLFLHIYTREVRPNASKKDSYETPVIVFVPGKLNPKAEEYRSEDLYGPQFLLEHEVVLVVLSYRRDILGFTAFQEPNDDLDVPFDAGVLDVMAGLRFVKNEIRHFGGCPDNVTAYGHGIGAMCVRAVAAEYGTDLFKKMILSSSTEFATIDPLCMRRYEVRALLREITTGEGLMDDKACIEFLRKLPVETLLKIDLALFPLLRSHEAYENVNHKLTDLRKENYKMTMPVLIGYNSLEASMDEIIMENCNSVVMRNAIAGNKEHRGQRALLKFYDEFYEAHRKLSHCQLDAISDMDYNIGTIGLAAHFVPSKNVYFYQFGVCLVDNLTTRLYDRELLNSNNRGAAHGDELGYIFKTPLMTVVEEGSVIETTIEKMTTLWTQFAWTGDPNPKKPIDNVRWKYIGEKLTKYFYIGTRFATYDRISNLEIKRLKFCEEYFGTNFFSGQLYTKTDKYKRKKGKGG